MKTMILAAAVLTYWNIGSGNAGEIEGITPDTFFAQPPGVIAQAPVATAQNGQAVQAYAARSNHQDDQSFQIANS